MIDFACKRFTLDEIIKCSLLLSKADYNVLNFLTKHDSERYTTEKMAKRLRLNQSTVQRAMKKLYEQGIVNRFQNNLEGGGYVFVYQIVPKYQLRKIILNIINNWVKRVEAELEKW